MPLEYSGPVLGAVAGVYQGEPRLEEARSNALAGAITATRSRGRTAGGGFNLSINGGSLTSGVGLQ